MKDKKTEFVLVYDDDNFIVHYDCVNKKYRVSYFEEGHFKEECYFDGYNEV